MIQTAEMLEVFQQYRGNAVVIPAGEAVIG